MTYSESSAALIIPLAALVLLGVVALLIVCLSCTRNPRKRRRTDA